MAFAVGNYRETYIIDYNDRYTQIMNGGICEWMYLNDLEYGDLFDPIDKLVSKITTSKKQQSVSVQKETERERTY